MPGVSNVNLFQSAPGLATGGNCHSLVRSVKNPEVSIRPRSRDRGKQWEDAPVFLDCKFQSAPGLATGGNGSVFDVLPMLPAKVSIRPRSRDRGKPQGFAVAQVTYRVSIRPRSRDRGKRGNTARPCRRAAVSIRPRSRDRGKLGVVMGPVSGILVSIRPRSRDRGKLGDALIDAGLVCKFQSAPGLATGGNRPGRSASRVYRDVSIRPRSRDRGKHQSHVPLASTAR